MTEFQDQVDVSLRIWKFACSVLLPCFLVFVGSGPRRWLPVAQRWSWRYGLWEAGRAAERLFKPTGPSRHSVHSVCNKVSFWSLLVRAFPPSPWFCLSLFGLPASWVMNILPKLPRIHGKQTSIPFTAYSCWPLRTRRLGEARISLFPDGQRNALDWRLNSILRLGGSRRALRIGRVCSDSFPSLPSELPCKRIRPVNVVGHTSRVFSQQGPQLGHKSLRTAWSHSSKPPQWALWESRPEPGVGFDPLHLWPAQEESGGPGRGQSHCAGCRSVFSSPMPSSFYESLRQAPLICKGNQLFNIRVERALLSGPPTASWKASRGNEIEVDSFCSFLAAEKGLPRSKTKMLCGLASS